MKEPNINILLAEDDENLGKLLWTYLKTKGLMLFSPRMESLLMIFLTIPKIALTP